MQLQEVVIVSAVRTPVGRGKKGTLAYTRPDDLAALVLRSVLERVKVDAKEVEDVVLGCAMPEGEQGLNMARMAALAAGYPNEVAGVTVNRFCASGLQAIAQAAQAIYQACQLASGNLPAAVALDLSTRAAGRLLGPAQLEKLEEKLLAGMPARGEQPAEGEGPVRIRYAELGEMGPAAAAVNTVVLDPAFVKGKDPVTVDFVMGHEFSHVRHKDVVAKLGFMAFSSSLNLLARQEPNLSQQLAIALMLQALGAQKSREIEFRCDREGVDFALSRGHSPEAVASAAEALFRQEKERGSTASATPLDTHPPNEERVRAIRQHLFPG